MTEEQRTSPWGDAALAVWAVLGDRPVAYHPALAKALGNDIPAALFLAQIMYWADKGTWKPGWVAKTQQDIYDETALTRSQQERVRRKLKALGVISERLMDVPARLYFRVHFAKLTKLLMADLQETHTSECAEPADKDAGNLQSEPAEPASQDAGNQQSIPESSTQTTQETTPQKSDGEPSHSGVVLDGVFGERGERSPSKILTGDMDDLSPDEKAQIATPGSGQARQNMDLVQASWYNTNRNVKFPFGINWVDVYEYACLFSDLFNIAVPSVASTITQWRRGIVETFIAFADEMAQAGHKRERRPIIRRARWCMQLLHARRIMGEDWTFDIVSPLSLTNTMRVIAGDLRKMQADMALGSMDVLPDEARVTMYYASKPGKKRPAMSGSDMTEQAILQLQGVELGVTT